MSRYRTFYRNTIAGLLIIVGLVAILVYVKKQPIEQSKPDREEPLSPVLMSRPEPPPISFVEEANARGIDFIPENGAVGDKWLPESMGSGVAVFDVENDGDLDLYFSNGRSWDDASPTFGRLYLNDGHARFSDHTRASGLDHSIYGTGVALGDVNRDGLMDLFVAAVGANQLYINQGNGMFQETTATLDCGNSDWSSSAGFFDYDQDGDDDLLVLNYISWSPDLDNKVNYQIEGIGKAYGPPNNFPGTQLCLFENHDGNFNDISATSGLSDQQLATSSKALGLVFWDVNQDHMLDVVVANDTVANQVFINLGNGRFSEQGGQSGIGFDAAGKATGAMGIDVAHYLNNDRTAIAIGNFGGESSSFYVSRTQLFFTDEAMISGIGAASRSVVGFGTFFFDYDLDGHLDFFQTNGHVENLIQQVESGVSYQQQNQLFWHCGLSCQPTYQLVQNAGDLSADALVGRAAAYGDLDADGDLDIIVTQVNAPTRLYINQQNTPHQWITLSLSTADHRSIIGATIEVSGTFGTQKHVYSQTRSYQSQVQPWITLGLGQNTTLPVKVTVTELNGRSHTRSFSSVNQVVNWEL
ncbi:CRTAC1 family protein [Marinicella sediminis]|uniref:CRTAC1 family protein n=1 Tax=Marinicella sediminis TaxID=1792834 RepID=A0ABV7JC47_9GAMM|nr:CRTAC1 family protein [Marinicella sediminis]